MVQTFCRRYPVSLAGNTNIGVLLTFGSNRFSRKCLHWDFPLYVGKLEVSIHLIPPELAREVADEIELGMKWGEPKRGMALENKTGTEGDDAGEFWSAFAPVVSFWES
jgi:hypothetical protein